MNSVAETVVPNARTVEPAAAPPAGAPAPPSGASPAVAGVPGPAPVSMQSGSAELTAERAQDAVTGEVGGARASRAAVLGQVQGATPKGLRTQNLTINDVDYRNPAQIGRDRVPNVQVGGPVGPSVKLDAPAANASWRYDGLAGAPPDTKVALSLGGEALATQAAGPKADVEVRMGSRRQRIRFSEPIVALDVARDGTVVGGTASGVLIRAMDQPEIAIRLPEGTKVDALAIDPLGSSVWVASTCRGQASLGRYDLRSGAPIGAIPLPKSAQRLQPALTGDLLVDDGSFCTILRGGRVPRPGDGESFPSGAVFSPTGRAVAFRDPGSGGTLGPVKGRIILEDRASRRRATIDTGVANLEALRFSPDGARLDAANREGSRAIVSFSVRGTFEARLEHPGDGAALPADRELVTLRTVRERYAARDSEIAALNPTLNPAAIRERATSPSAPGYNGTPVGDAAVYDPTHATKRGRVGLLNLWNKADPVRATPMLAVLRDRRWLESFVKNRPDETTAGIGRPAWLALAAAQGVGEMLGDALDEDARAMSRALKASLRGFAQLGGKPYYPEVVIGTGPQGANYAFTKKTDDPSAGILMIEQSASLGGGNFARIGDAFYLNSSNRPQTGARPRAGTAETLNPIAGPISPADLSGRRYGPGSTIATASAVAIAAADVDTLLEEEFVGIEDGFAGSNLPGTGKADGPWPGRYKVLLASGLTVFTDRVVFAAGLGTKPNLGFFAEPCRAFLAAELAKVDADKPDELPRVLGTADALALALRAERGRDPYRDGKVTAIVGPGDSGAVFLEYLHGMAPEEVYLGEGRQDPAQRGVIGENLWFVTPKGPRTCDDYKDRTRPRYAQIQTLLKSREGKPRVQLAASNVTRIDPITEGPDAGRLLLTCEGFRPGDATGAAAEIFTQVVDRVVLATGYERDTTERLRGVLPADVRDYRTQLIDVTGTPRGFDAPVAVARRLATEQGEQDVYFIGPAAGQLPSDEELVGIKENAVGLFGNTPRTEAFARDLAARERGTTTSPKTSDAVGGYRDRFLAAFPPRIGLVRGPAQTATLGEVLRASPQDLKGDSELAVKVGIAAVLLEQRPPLDGKPVALAIARAGTSLVLTGEIEILNPIAAAIASDRALVRRLSVMTQRQTVRITCDSKAGEWDLGSFAVRTDRTR